MPYNALDTQKLFRQVENGQFRSLPGGDLIQQLYEQLRVADTVIIGLDQAIRNAGFNVNPELLPVFVRPATVRPSIENPLGRPPPGSPAEIVVPQQPRPVAPPIAAPTPPGPTPVAAAAPFGSPYFAGAREEAPAPIPFKDTPDGVAKPPEVKPKRGRRKHIAP